MSDNRELQIHIKVKNLIADIDFMIPGFRKQNYFEALQKGGAVLNHLSEAAELILANISMFQNDNIYMNPEDLFSILNEILMAQQAGDYVLLADLYELSLLPLLLSIQRSLIAQHSFLCDDDRYGRTLYLMKEKEDLYGNIWKLLQNCEEVSQITEHGFHVEHTESGEFTLAYETMGVKHYLHSNGRVYQEAALLAAGWYDLEKEEYVIYGLSLGYHIRALLEICGYSKVRIYESNLHIIKAAAAFGALEEILNDSRVTLIYDVDFKGLHHYLSNSSSESILLVYYPSLYAISNRTEAEMLEDYFIKYSSMKGQQKFLDGNFKRNINLYDAPVDSLKDGFTNKDIYIVAAGPSLDYNIEHLIKMGRVKSFRDNSIILAVGTVFTKLLKLGLVPDYIVASDAKPNTYTQIGGQLDKLIPLIGLSTLYYKFFQEYSGKKYIVFQNHYDKSVSFANEHGLKLYETGGSVVTVALDIALRFSPKRVIFVGLDLAYTYGLRHASGTKANNSIEASNLIQVEDVFGKPVATGKNLNIYRKWIEQRILKETSIEVIDATEGGAYIKGTKRMTLKQILNES